MLDEIECLRAALAASETIRAGLESRLASWSEDKLRASNLKLTEQIESAVHLRAALAEAERERQSLRDTCVVLDKHNDALEAELALLREALETSPCPSPARDGIYTVKECIEIGDCGCNNGAAIDGAGVYNATQGDKKLIAAAPDLLAALRDAISCLEHASSEYCVGSGYDESWKACRDDAVKDARAAIAKATGKGSGA